MKSDRKYIGENEQFPASIFPYNFGVFEGECPTIKLVKDLRNSGMTYREIYLKTGIRESVCRSIYLSEN